MTAVKDAAARIIRMGRFQQRPDRLLEIELSARQLDEYGMKSEKFLIDEDPDTFLARVAASSLERLPSREMRALIDLVWMDDHHERLARAGLDVAVAANRKSYDRAIIAAYLRHFPTHHPAFRDLLGAVQLVAGRRNWPWAARGTRWRLWDAEEGPRTVAGHLLVGNEPPGDALRTLGLDGDLSEGRFLAAALAAACRTAADEKDARAAAAGAALVRLFDHHDEGASRLNAHLARALLKPWQSATPPEALHADIIRLLVRRIGDPRLVPAKWRSLQDELSGSFPGEDLAAILGILKRWLVKATVRQFFEVIGRTTTNTEQWRQREAFWLAYLDANVIEDAWFAFGRRAEIDARRLVRELEGGAYGVIEGGGDAGHSALLMKIGDLLIAEWSHNGMCRFWGPAAHDRPKLGERQYSDRVLRRTREGPDFDAFSHFSGWPSRFAYNVYKKTGIRHPKVH